ncbi:UNVERIFIED_CONTAM: hypothetical protein K2H54_045639 [Gekko kuhli]
MGKPSVALVSTGFRNEDCKLADQGGRTSEAKPTKLVYGEMANTISQSPPQPVGGLVTSQLATLHEEAEAAISE